MKWIIITGNYMDTYHIMCEKKPDKHTYILYDSFLWSSKEAKLIYGGNSEYGYL